MFLNLFLISLFPILGIFIILFFSVKEKRLLKLIALNFSCLSFISVLFLWLLLDKFTLKFQFIQKVLILPLLNLNLIVGIDGISLLFLILSTFLIPISILSSWSNINNFLKEFLILFLLLDFLLIQIFIALDLLFFYIFFESVLIPMFLIIGVWGSRDRKILAAYYFFMYTFFGSVFMLLGIIYIFSQVGTTDYELLLTFSFTIVEQKLLWGSFFLSFAVKIPMFPFHLWLAEAHVEAPTAGSIILAGILLKLGVYGFIRFSLPLFPKATYYFTPLVYFCGTISIIFASFTAVRQTDFKRIIAYTSIAHMNLVVLGIFSFNSFGLEGAIFQSLSHGFVSSALFLLIGIIYDRYKTRTIQYYSGVAIIMPLYTLLFLFFSLANIGFPCTSNFVGEFLILLGLFKINIIVSFLCSISMVISSCYSLWLFNRISFSNLKNNYILKFYDINFREFCILVPLLLSVFILGVYSNIFLNNINFNVNFLLELFYL